MLQKSDPATTPSPISILIYTPSIMQFYLSCLWFDYCEMSESKVCNDSLHMLI